MAGGILGIGINSLLAYKSAITTTAQNLSNATTPYFSRREVNFAEALFNSGVTISDVKRVFDDVANEDFINKTSTAGSLSTYYDSISDFEKSLDDDKTNIAKYMNDSLNACQVLTTTVGNIQSRTAYLSQLSALANRIRGMSNEISEKKSILNDNIRSNVEQANAILTQIGQMNRQISLQTSGDRSDMLDQRNKMVHELAGYLNFTVRNEPNDGLSLSLSNGIEVVSGQTVRTFSTMDDDEDATLLRIGLESGYSGTLDVSSFITEGSLGGMVNLRQGSYDNADRGLGRLALVIADQFNRQNKLGSDLNGELGTNIFNDINSAALMAGRVIGNSNNTGSGVFAVSIDDVSQLNVSDYRMVFSSATAYSIERNSDGQTVSSGTIGAYPETATFDGMTLTIDSGTFAAGDKFLIRPYQGAGASTTVAMVDPKKLAMAFPVSAEPNTSNLGTGSIRVDSIEDTTNAAFTTTNKALAPPVRVEFLTDTTYQLVDVDASTVIEGPLTYDPAAGEDLFPTAGSYDPGYRVSLSGSMKAGDSFLIDYNANTIGDNRNALEMAGLYTKKIIDGNETTMNAAYISISSQVSLQTNTAKTQLDSALTLVDQAEKRFYSVSGVDSMNELTNLTNYQQSYQASAQIIQSARTIFETLLGMLR
ncbi:MAG TPA: flagellar basal body rod C-terminal domain-containing protein [Gammaproteobacteria bacterium]|nr:flagellar basal body rod C-terminal domain-containing protein [Gammaproteobacteria bacterium]